MPKSTADKVKKDLQKGTLSPVYLLTGDDVYRKNELVELIKAAAQPDDFNFYRGEADKADLGEVLALANTAPVFSNARLIILGSIEKLRKEPKEALIKYIEYPLPTTTLVLLHNDSKKMKTEKVLGGAAADQGTVVNFDELKQDELNLWVRSQLKEKGLTADFDAVDLLCESVGSELNAIEQELEKLYLYTHDRANKTVTKEDILACIGFNKEENPFALSNAVQSCNKNLAVRLIDRLLDNGEDAVGVLSKITYPILKMARVKRLSNRGMAAGEILQAAGLMFWEKNLVASARALPSEEAFLRALNRIIDTDAAFKSSSGTDPKIALKGIILTLFSK